ncbi:hypothetical protein ACU4GI_33410 [Cupriavidus basilensis]
MKFRAQMAWAALAGWAGVVAAFLFIHTPGSPDPTPGALNALACVFIGLGIFFGVLAYHPPGRTGAVQWQRYTFAVAAAIAANVITTWGLWAIGVPIENGAVRRGLMAEHYWLGPAAMAYAVVCWVFYRRALAGEAR